MYYLRILLLYVFGSYANAQIFPVHFWLFTINNLDSYEDMTFNGESVILSENTLFDPSKPTKIVVHGWGGKTHIDEMFARAYANAGLDYNIVGVDWRDMEGTPQEQVVSVGEYTAFFILALVRDYGLQLTDVHPVGWSYGAHVVANIGKEINRSNLGKLKRMTLLDPGEYGFTGPEHEDLIISKADADFIDVIHTDGLGYGFLKPLGHADFYPNGGVSQPCSCSHPCEGVNCTWKDHGRAPAYFEESILSTEKFPAWKCEISWEEFVLLGKCPFEPETSLVHMGEWSDKVEEGVYYLTTRRESPFSCEDDDCFFP